MARSGLIRKDHGGYSVVRDIANNGLNDRRSVAANKISTVVNGLVYFAQSRFGKTWTDQDATTAVIAFLSRFSIECLRTFERGTALPEIEDDNQSEIYIVSKFLKWAHSEHEDLFRKAMILVKGHMLANALLCPDLESIQKNFKHVIFYVDTTLLLNIIDLGGQVSQEAAAELFKLIEALEGRVAIFSHTIDELKSVIGAAASHVASANTEMPAALAARRQGLRQSDLLIMAEDVEQRLLGHGLKVKSTPRATQAFQISESELQSAIEHEANYGNPRALEYDINSIRSVYELRGGLPAPPFRRCPCSLINGKHSVGTCGIRIWKKTVSRKRCIGSYYGLQLGEHCVA